MYQRKQVHWSTVARAYSQVDQSDDKREKQTATGHDCHFRQQIIMSRIPTW